MNLKQNISSGAISRWIPHWLLGDVAEVLLIELPEGLPQIYQENFQKNLRGTSGDTSELVSIELSKRVYEITPGNPSKKYNKKHNNFWWSFWISSWLNFWKITGNRNTDARTNWRFPARIFGETVRRTPEGTSARVYGVTSGTISRRMNSHINCWKLFYITLLNPLEELPEELPQKYPKGQSSGGLPKASTRNPESSVSFLGGTSERVLNSQRKSQ